jgi:hypothetical protein
MMESTRSGAVRLFGRVRNTGASAGRPSGERPSGGTGASGVTEAGVLSGTDLEGSRRGVVIGSEEY